jgi:hypothetical protein
MNGRFQMQGGKNWILSKEINANRFFWDTRWLEMWSNHLCPTMGPNGESVAMDSEGRYFTGAVERDDGGEDLQPFSSRFMFECLMTTST